MDQRKSLIIAVLGIIVIVAIIVGTVVFLVRGVKSRASTATPQPTSVSTQIPVFGGSPAPLASVVPAASPASTAGSNANTQTNLKTYNGSGFSLQYPKGWGVLTCSNSANFELDPYNGIDQSNVSCTYAQKPITILVGNVTCNGETVKIGNTSVIKSARQTNNGTNYRWCTQTQPMLDITHRVSQTAGQAISNQDFSKDIEEIIKTFKTGTGS